MDLLDGSDVDEGDVDLEEENALLGSDDEENYAGVGVEYEYDEEHILHTEDSDVLELELNGEDGLEFEEDQDAGGRRNVAPVQVRPSAIPSRQNSRNNSNYTGMQQQHSTESVNQQESYGSESGPGGKTEVDGEDDEDEDDDRNTRSRFQSERNTQEVTFSSASTSGSSSSFGNPIQTLGGRKVLTGDGQKPKWPGGRPHNNPYPPGQRQFVRPQRFNHNRHPLLGEGPRPGFNPFLHRPQLNGVANVQFQERIFTDFNRPIRNSNPQQLAVVHGQRGNAGPGPRHQVNMNSNGPRPGMPMGGPPRRQVNPAFAHGNNNRQMRPRNQNPGHMNQQRPPQQWRHQRPQRHPFPCMPNQPMQNMPQIQPGPPTFHQEQMQMQRPPLFGHGMRQELHPQSTVPFSNLPGPNLRAVPPTPFGPGPILGQQFRMPMGPPELLPPPVQPVQPFFHAQQQLQQQHQQHQHQQQPFMQDAQNSQGFWPPQNNENNGWNGPPGPQTYIGNVPGPQVNSGFQIPAESVMSNQPPHFVEPQTQQGRPLPNYDQLNTRPAYYEQHQHERQNYEFEQERHGNNFEYENRSQVRVPDISIRRETFEERLEYQYRQERNVPSKRKYEPEDTYYRGSPEKRLNGRLGPPVKHEPPPRDEKAEEQLKIREETRKTMGLDDEYIKRLEDQKKLREQILRRKAEARRKINTVGDAEDENYSRKIANELLKTEAVTASATGRPSIYINPRAFRGDLSALNSNLKKINVHSGETEGRANSTSENVPSSSKVSTTAVRNDGSVGTISIKPRTILRIVKDKFGNEISRSKVIVRPKQQPSASTKAS